MPVRSVTDVSQARRHRGHRASDDLPDRLARRREELAPAHALGRLRDLEGDALLAALVAQEVEHAVERRRQVEVGRDRAVRRLGQREVAEDEPARHVDALLAAQPHVQRGVEQPVADLHAGRRRQPRQREQLEAGESHAHAARRRGRQAQRAARRQLAEGRAHLDLVRLLASHDGERRGRREPGEQRRRGLRAARQLDLPRADVDAEANRLGLDEGQRREVAHVELERVEHEDRGRRRRLVAPGQVEAVDREAVDAHLGPGGRWRAGRCDRR
jgi:hypothetical protein